MPREKPMKPALVTEDKFAGIVRAFMRSPKFRDYSRATQELWGRELNFMSRPDCLGDFSREEIRPSLVQAYFDGISDFPGKQAAGLTALKQLEGWAVVRDLLPRQITLGVEIGESDGGHIPWTEEQVALAEQYARPDLARVVTLGANTGQRGSDLIRMSPTDRELYNGVEGHKVIQKKTGREVWIPIISTLATAMAKWERRPGPYLVRTDGRPWLRKDLTAAWAWERDHNPHLEPLRAIGPDKDRPAVLHGLRGHACVRLLRAGANTRQISDMVGMSEEMVKNYTRFSEQRDNAVAAVFHMERTIRERSGADQTKTAFQVIDNASVAISSSKDKLK